ncbi:MAG: hypothetical protein AB7T59_15090 [Hyphomonadaceae bacterium]
MTREDVLAFVLTELGQMKVDGMVDPNAEINEEAVLIGSRGIVDSHSLVNLLLSLEDHIEAVYGRCFDWNNDRAMSAKRSPFRTPSTLASFAVEACAA